MNNSNYTLRFPRTYREATGRAFYSSVDGELGDKLVAWVTVICAAFVIGMAVGASL